jgi:hypothetical protein
VYNTVIGKRKIIFFMAILFLIEVQT